MSVNYMPFEMAFGVYLKFFDYNKLEIYIKKNSY